MRLLFINLLLLISIYGCSSVGPKNNVDFKEVAGINNLEGVYKNQGESGDYKDVYLSEIIWPTASDIDHYSIETIEVRQVDNNTIKVKALDGSKLIKESLFREGEDFEITNDVINIKNKVTPSLAYPAGNPFIGLAVETIDIGIDKKGDGKYRSTTSLAGLVYLIPIVTADYEDVRFKKIAE